LKFELDISVAKMGNSAFFSGKQQILWQTLNSAAQCENPHAAEYCWPWYSVYYGPDVAVDSQLF